MNRRTLLHTTAGLIATAVAENCWAVQVPEPKTESFRFRPWRGPTMGQVICVTPTGGNFVHTYYDVCPFSPSQRYVAATRLPFQDRRPVLGETADVCVIDLEERTIRMVYTTRSWGFQTGANLHWGATDGHLYCNDVIGDQAVCVGIDLQTGRIRAYAGPMYDIAPDESCVIGFPLELLDITQHGYGVPAPDPQHPRQLPPGASEGEGIWRTDLNTNAKTLLISLAIAATKLPEPPPQRAATFYFWHSKFNKQGTRIMQVLRCLFPDGSGGRNVNVLTFNVDGSDVRRTQSFPVWGHGGGHPNWHPDGEHLIRNLKPGGSKKDRLCKIPADGSDITVLSDTIDGGGHPTIEPAERYIITDTHTVESELQCVKIRLIDLKQQTELALCEIPTIDRRSLSQTVLRLDGHPAWSRNYKKVLFQAAPEGRRQLLLGDLEGVI
ncbi:TolB family protein [Planctomycetota bacterium]